MNCNANMYDEIAVVIVNERTEGSGWCWKKFGRGPEKFAATQLIRETRGWRGLQRGVNVSLFHRAVLMLRICSVFRPTRRQSFDALTQSEKSQRRR